MRRPARLRLAAGLLAGLALAVTASAMDWRLEGGAGWRRLNEPGIRQAYGTGIAVPIGFDLILRSGWEAGLRFEWAPTRDGALGVYASAARFHLLGLEATAGRELRRGIVGLYARVGAGLYHYRQTVDYAYVQDYKVNRFAPGAMAAAGFRIYPWPFLYLAADAKYVVLGVSPYDVSVDLGGWRLGGSLGLVFK